ncbi:response regulator [Chitinophaga niabensis]|uniref:response regulator n=1 Tax=Chitinophaga niabensis TaxID=536979 RepID=UPI0031BADCC9
MPIQNSPGLSIVLADDDLDDCLLFQEALNELQGSFSLTIVNDGDRLMKLLKDRQDALPEMIFLDINMPRKNGVDCLIEIKGNNLISHIPVVIFSTSFEPSLVERLYNIGANHYIQKPSGFYSLTQVLLLAINIILKERSAKPTADQFVLFPSEYEDKKI